MLDSDPSTNHTPKHTHPFRAVGTAGQRCTTTRRLLLHTDVYDAFIAQLVKVGWQEMGGLVGGWIYTVWLLLMMRFLIVYMYTIPL